MAKLFTFTTGNNLSCISQRKFLHSSNRFLKASSSPCLLNPRGGFSKVSCSIKDKEHDAEKERMSPIVTGPRLDDELGEKSERGFEKLGFENLNWPPWKDVPQDINSLALVHLLLLFVTLIRIVLQFGVLAWSLATVGIGVSPSAAMDLIARLIPLEERSRAVSLASLGSSLD